MIEYYNNLLDEERKELTQVIKVLQSQTFLLERKLDRKSNRFIVNPIYRVCEQHFEFIKAYFQIADIDLIENRQYGIIGIQSSITQGEKLGKLTTIFILLLKLIYDEKMSMASNTVEVVAQMNELYEKIQLFSLWDNKNLPITEVKRALATLKRYQMIEVMGSMEELVADTRIIIYPTIQLLLDMEAVKGMIASYQGEMEESDEYGENMKENQGEDDETNERFRWEYASVKQTTTK